MSRPFAVPPAPCSERGVVTGVVTVLFLSLQLIYCLGGSMLFTEAGNKKVATHYNLCKTI